MEATIILNVNGQEKTIVTDPERPLLEVLREELHLTGPHYGCGEGQCGACTVLIDGRRTTSCITPVGKVGNRKILTIEGLSDGDKLHPVQQAFLDEGAIQCGYCTPGMVLTAVSLLHTYPNPTDEQIKIWMNGNICRCNGYTKIFKAVRRAAEKMTEARS